MRDHIRVYPIAGNLILSLTLELSRASSWHPRRGDVSSDQVPREQVSIHRLPGFTRYLHEGFCFYRRGERDPRTRVEYHDREKNRSQRVYWLPRYPGLHQDGLCVQHHGIEAGVVADTVTVTDTERNVINFIWHHTIDNLNLGKGPTLSIESYIYF